jgi:hypothetical protein
MFSESFCGAGSVMSEIRAFSKVHFRELYMVGNFYITIIKLFAVLLGLIICYFALMEAEPDYYYNAINLIAPLVVNLHLFRLFSSQALKFRHISLAQTD